MIEETIPVIERQFKFLQNHEGIHFFYQLRRFFDFLNDNPLTSSVLKDMATENLAMLDMFREHEKRQITKLKRVRSDIKREWSDLWISPEGVDQELPENMDYSPEAFDRIVKRPQEVLIPGKAGDREDPSRVGHLADIISHLLSEPSGKEKIKLNPVLAQNIERRLFRVFEDHRHQMGEWIFSVASSGSCSLLRLSYFVSKINPAPDYKWFDLPVSEKGEKAMKQIFSLSEPLRKNAVADELSGDENEQLAFIVSDAKAEAEKLVEELIVRLGEQRSLHGLFDRFKMKCEWLLADELCKLAEKGRGKAEDRLAERAASYLFDLGMTPVIRPIMGRLEPDIVGLSRSGRWMPYIEVKQYKNTKGKGIIKAGARQVWDTAGRLSSLGIREAFLVVFRRDGPRYCLPPVVHGDNIRLYPLLIDIAPGEQSGSRQKRTPIEIVVEELAPNK